ncbi:MAG: hypothetical protein H0X33_07020 [Taibaiella sp.]|nr:hypothetical protein [Taibaiella sp.]
MNRIKGIAILVSIGFCAIMQGGNWSMSLCLVAVLLGIYGLVLLINGGTQKVRTFINSNYACLADAALMALWIWATGGYVSPYYILFYIFIGVVAYRLEAWMVIGISLLYVLSYVGLLFSLHTPQIHLPEILLRCSYIFISGVMVWMVKKEIFRQPLLQDQIDALQQQIHECNVTIEQRHQTIEELDETIKNTVQQRLQEMEDRVKEITTNLEQKHYTVYTNVRALKLLLKDIKEHTALVSQSLRSDEYEGAAIFARKAQEQLNTLEEMMRVLTDKLKAAGVNSID